MHPKNESRETRLCFLDFRFAYASPVVYLLESAPGSVVEWAPAYAAMQDVRLKIL
jgi:hypothetical protein